jgi:hypothetical protein
VKELDCALGPGVGCYGHEINISRNVGMSIVEINLTAADLSGTLDSASSQVALTRALTQ